MDIRLEDIMNLCKRRAIIFPSGEIYGGLAGFFDYGPIGIEIKRKILNSWWEFFVIRRDDVYGISPSIITTPKVWKASGHVDEFIDILLECTSCKARYKAETLLEEYNIDITDLSLEGISKIIEEHDIRCPKCKGKLGAPRRFNLMIEAQVGPVRGKESISYLRPEIAQGMFINFKLISIAMGAKLPFGIAGHGRVFRNEISPRTFVFRCREFEIAEIEYFIDPEEKENCPFFGEVKNIRIKLLTKEMQKRKEEPVETSIEEAYNDGVFSNKWHAYWCGKALEWLISMGLSEKNLRLREHLETELAHYAQQTFDIEYYFPFLGWKEIAGIANRTDYDLRRHAKYSGEKLYIVQDGRKIFPFCIEPTFGIERIFFALITEAYTVVNGKIVLKLSPNVAPFDVGVFPLLKREQFINKALEINNMLRKNGYATYVDTSGKIGRCYAKADEIGVPFAITIDHQTLKDNTVTVRFRDTKNQVRINIYDLPSKLREFKIQFK